MFALPVRIQCVIGLLFLLAVVPCLSAQNGAEMLKPGAPISARETPPKPALDPLPPANSNGTHRFWDRENGLLFAGVAAGRGLDYASTMNLRRRGIDEVFLTNSIVDNHPLFVGIEAAATAASIGVSYAFHATGHHRLERWTSVVHIGVAVGGAARNYALKTPHPN